MTYKEASNKAKEDKAEILLIFCNRDVEPKTLTFRIEKIFIT